MYKKAIASARKEKARNVKTGVTPQQVQEFREVRPCGREWFCLTFKLLYGITPLVWHAYRESCMEDGIGLGQLALGRAKGQGGDWSGRPSGRVFKAHLCSNQAADVPQLNAASLFRYRYGTKGFTLQYRTVPVMV